MNWVYAVNHELMQAYYVIFPRSNIWTFYYVSYVNLELQLYCGTCELVNTDLTF